MVEEPAQSDPVMAQSMSEVPNPGEEFEPDPDEAPKPTSVVISSPPMAEEPQFVEDIQPSEPKPPITAPPAPVEQSERKGTPQMLTLVMRSLGDKERDILRMRRVYGMLISDPGPDRFAFYVIERNRGYRLEFPSDTTHLTDELRRKLEQLMSAENVIVEPITIQ